MPEIIRPDKEVSIPHQWKELRIEGWLPSGGGNISYQYGPQGLKYYSLQLNTELNSKTIDTLLRADAEVYYEDKEKFRSHIEKMIPKVLIRADKRTNTGIVRFEDKEVISRSGDSGSRIWPGSNLKMIHTEGLLDKELGWFERVRYENGAAIIYSLFTSSTNLFELDKSIASQIEKDPTDYQGFRQIAEPYFFITPLACSL